MTIERYLSVIPKTEYIPAFDPKPETGWSGAKALWYEGAPYQGKTTKVFAYIGYPDKVKTEKVPAVVLVHGGGGHAYAHWVRLWNQRGYAAIAMDTTGFVPSEECMGLAGVESGPHEKYVRYLHHGLEDEDYSLGPNNDEMLQWELPMQEQWMYHAIIDTILAHNILKMDPKIDKNKIGISGVSWGGVITSLAIGYDTDYAFAVPFYGSAYLGYAVTKVTHTFREKEVKKNWSAEARISNISFPVLWVSALQDQCFCSYSNSRSYLVTKGNGSLLSIQENLAHSHVDAWNLEEGFRFADCVLADKDALARPICEPHSFGRIECTIEIPPDVENVNARAIYFTEDFHYDENGRLTNEWHEVPATVTNNVVSTVIPKKAYSYYLEFVSEIGKKTYISTTSLVRHERNK